MLALNGFLDIPTDLVAEIPCQRNRQLFIDPALDVDFDDEEFYLLQAEEKLARLDAKAAAEERAKAACAGCPILDSCREWAMKTHVFGVAGGMSQDERAQAVGIAPEVILDVTQRGPNGQVRDDLIERWTAQGITTIEIARRLECAPRTVERRRALIARGTARRYGADNPRYLRVATQDEALSRGRASSQPASGDLSLGRLTPETKKMYQILATGLPKNRDLLVQELSSSVDTATAEHWGRRTAGDAAARQTAGRRKFLLNRIDIAARRGRVILGRDDEGNVTVKLAADLVGALPAEVLGTEQLSA